MAHRLLSGITTLILLSALGISSLKEAYGATAQLSTTDFRNEGNSYILNHKNRDWINITLNFSRFPYTTTKKMASTEKSFYFNGDYTIPNNAVANTLKGRSFTIPYLIDFKRGLREEDIYDNETNTTITLLEYDNHEIPIMWNWAYVKDYTLYIDNIDAGGTIDQYKGQIVGQIPQAGTKVLVEVNYTLPNSLQAGTIITMQDGVTQLTTCGLELNIRGEVYDMINDVSNSYATCYNITNSSIILDGHGFFINSTASIQNNINISNTNHSIIRSITLIVSTGNNIIVHDRTMLNLTVINSTLRATSSGTNIRSNSGWLRNSTFINNVINNSGQTGATIFVDLGTYYTNLSYNKIIGGTSGQTFYCRSCQNNTIIS